jgi:hypothetical protein
MEARPASRTGGAGVADFFDYQPSPESVRGCHFVQEEESRQNRRKQPLNRPASLQENAGNRKLSQAIATWVFCGEGVQSAIPGSFKGHIRTRFTVSYGQLRGGHYPDGQPRLVGIALRAVRRYFPGRSPRRGDPTLPRPAVIDTLRRVSHFEWRIASPNPNLNLNLSRLGLRLRLGLGLRTRHGAAHATSRSDA